MSPVFCSQAECWSPAVLQFIFLCSMTTSLSTDNLFPSSLTSFPRNRLSSTNVCLLACEIPRITRHSLPFLWVIGHTWKTIASFPLTNKDIPASHADWILQRNPKSSFPIPSHAHPSPHLPHGGLSHPACSCLTCCQITRALAWEANPQQS